MSAFLKPKTKSSPVSAQLFGQLQNLFANPKTPTVRCVSAELERSRHDFHRVSFEELNALRETVRSLAVFVNKIVPEESKAGADAKDADLAQARHEDEIAQRALQKAKTQAGKSMTTPQSVREGDALIAHARATSKATMASRIAKGEFLTSGELQGRLNIKRASISEAVKVGRMFAVVGPSGDNFYPAYFADEELDRRSVEKVSKSLGTLPASSKHHFFTAKSTLLDATPIDALRKGRIDEVLTAAAAFVER